MKNTRKAFMSGKQLPECRICFGEEANKEEDNRYFQFFDQQYGHLTQDILNNTTPDGETTQQPIYIDYRNSLCNLKCKTCSADASSSIAAASNNSTGKKVFPIVNYKNTFSQQWDDLKQILNKDTNMIYWAGGEPLINPIYWKTMAYLEEQGWTNIQMIYHTNMVKLKDEATFQKALHYMNLFPSKINLSIDGIKEVNEYVRSGSNWTELDKTIQTMAQTLGTDKITLDVTLTNITTLQLPEITQYAHNLGLGITAKAMMESKGFQLYGEHHDNNTFLSTNLLKPSTIQTIINQLKEQPTNPIYSNILDIMNYIQENHKPRPLGMHDVMAIRDYQNRHNDTLDLITILKNQSL